MQLLNAPIMIIRPKESAVFLNNMIPGNIYFGNGNLWAFTMLTFCY